MSGAPGAARFVAMSPSDVVAGGVGELCIAELVPEERFIVPPQRLHDPMRVTTAVIAVMAVMAKHHLLSPLEKSRPSFLVEKAQLPELDEEPAPRSEENVCELCRTVAFEVDAGGRWLCRRHLETP